MNDTLRLSALAAAFVLAPASLDAQQTAPRNTEMRANSVYTELGGNIGDFSINYDRLVGKATVVRVGYGTLSDSYGSCFGIGLISACEGEVSVNLLGFTVSRLVGHRHMAELGVGGALGNVTDKNHPVFVVGETTTEKETVNTVTATIGYRWQGAGRWLVRAGYTPSYVIRGETANYSNRGFASMIGASFGLAF